MAIIAVRVTPDGDFFEHKETENTCQQDGKNLVRREPQFERFGQQMQKGRGQQSAGGHAQHMLGVTRHEAKAQCSRHPYAADAGDQGTHQYRYQQHSYN